MFAELPKQFDRNFIVGFFSPAAIFMLFSAWLLKQDQSTADLVSYVAADLLVGITLFVLLSWVAAIVLLALNHDLYRFSEGYGKYNPIKFFGWLEQQRYRRVMMELEKLDDQYRECIDAQVEFPVESRTRRNEIMRQLAEEFPDREEYLLPTPFGNVLRSFEIYSRVMYGFDAIEGWGRLLAIIPKDFLGLIDGAKAQVDFWINLGMMMILLQIEYISLTLLSSGQLNMWIVLLFIALGVNAVLRATSSAREWGYYVKSAIDMFVPKLRDILGFDMPKDRQEEIKQWTGFSQAIVYRIPYVLPNLRGYRVKSISNVTFSEEQITVGGNLQGNFIAGDGNIIYVTTDLPSDSATDAPLPIRKRKKTKR